MDTVLNLFFLICIIILAVLTFLCLIRTIKGPRLVDRIVGTNMIGTMTIAIIALLAAYLNESSILDICFDLCHYEFCGSYCINEDLYRHL